MSVHSVMSAAPAADQTGTPTCVVYRRLSTIQVRGPRSASWTANGFRRPMRIVGHGAHGHGDGTETEKISDAEAMLLDLLAITRSLGSATGLNIVAFSGGVDSSLVAWLVQKSFGGERCMAVIGRSAGLSQLQLATARKVAAHIDIRLLEVPTSEGDLPGYLQNMGAACYHCKSTLYSALEAVARTALEASDKATLFNGTNADDKLDATRVGLVAACEHGVASPLAHLTKASVRVAAHAAGLPNWDYAASPCLRSRLAFGVAATQAALARTEAFEAAVRDTLRLAPSEPMRVRTLNAGDGAPLSMVLEVSEGRLEDAKAALHTFPGLSSVRAFVSGSVARLQPGIDLNI